MQEIPQNPLIHHFAKPPILAFLAFSLDQIKVSAYFNFYQGSIPFDLIY
jgi:hypothetical protein